MAKVKIGDINEAGMAGGGVMLMPPKAIVEKDD